MCYLLSSTSALYIWLVASLMLDAPMPLGCRLLNHMALQPAMANPFGAATVREFWGRRYNQIVSSILQVCFRAHPVNMASAGSSSYPGAAAVVRSNLAVRHPRTAWDELTLFASGLCIPIPGTGS